MKDKNFYKRILIITNNGIQILKTFNDNKNCESCLPYQFCPRGPTQNLCIRFSDIITIVNFLELP